MEQRTRTVAATLAQVEGHLLARAEADAAQAAAEAFADRMPWLSGAQREEVVRLYAADRLALTRRTLEHIAARCHALRGEYGTRYEELRRRVLCRAVALVAAVTALCSAVLWLAALR